jgi:hypothetical protein
MSLMAGLAPLLELIFLHFYEADDFGPGGRLRRSSVNFSHSVAAQISVVACPNVRMMVATFVAVSMSGAVKMSR